MTQCKNCKFCEIQGFQVTYDTVGPEPAYVIRNPDEMGLEESGSVPIGRHEGWNSIKYYCGNHNCDQYRYEHEADYQCEYGEVGTPKRLVPSGAIAGEDPVMNRAILIVLVAIVLGALFAGLHLYGLTGILPVLIFAALVWAVEWRRLTRRRK